MKLLREPLLHFLLIGATFFLLYVAFSEPVSGQADKTITISSAEIDWLQSSWKQRWNRLPTQDELDGLINSYVREIVLYREALALGLDKDDTIIRRRLGMKMEFLVTDMLAVTTPTDNELRTYLNENIGLYQEPTLYTFTQVFFDPEKRGTSTLEYAESVKSELVAAGDAIENPGAMGDSLMLENDYVNQDQLDIRNLFGNVFAESLLSMTVGQWHGPVPSGYGAHLVKIHQIDEPPPPIFAELREQLVQDWTMEKSEELKQQFLESLRDQYTIVIEQPGTETGISPASQ